MKSRKGQLVSQHLENVSREALENYQDIIKKYVRGRQGIYALYRRGRLYYVGLATNLRNRLKHHYSGPRNLDSVISYTRDAKRGGPSGTNAQEVSAFI